MIFSLGLKEIFDEIITKLSLRVSNSVQFNVVVPNNENETNGNSNDKIKSNIGITKENTLSVLICCSLFSEVQELSKTKFENSESKNRYILSFCLKIIHFRP